MKLSEQIKRGKTRLAILIDPDKFNVSLVKLADKQKVSFFLVGGSSLKKNNLTAVISQIKKQSKKPVFIFPGDETQLSKKADGLLLLSLISGRNPEYLIGKHVKAASQIKKLKIETLATGYILIEGQNTSATQKISGTKAMKSAGLKAIIDTAVAGELLGMKAIYLEAGSGARRAVNSGIIRAVKKSISIPLIVGGGIDSCVKAENAKKAGADIVVVGNALEKNISLLPEIAKAF